MSIKDSLPPSIALALALRPRGFWEDEGKWADDQSGFIFLARALHQVGFAVHGGKWTGREPLATITPPPPTRTTINDPKGLLTKILYPNGPPTKEEVAERAAMFEEMRRQHNADAEEAIKRLDTVQSDMARQMRDGNLKYAYRHPDGGLPTEGPAYWWATERDKWKWRFNLCRINQAHPFNIPTGADYPLFVEAESFAQYLATLPFQPAKEPAPSAAGDGQAPSAASTDPQADGEQAKSRKANRPASYPIITLSEALTWMACGEYVNAPRLSEIMHDCAGQWPSAKFAQLEEVGERLAVLMLDGKVVLFGQRQEHERAPINPAEAIPASFIVGGAHMEPASDTIESDILLDARWEGVSLLGASHDLPSIYPCYRNVRLDARQLESALASSSAPPADMVSPPAPGESPRARSETEMTAPDAIPPSYKSLEEADRPLVTALLEIAGREKISYTAAAMRVLKTTTAQGSGGYESIVRRLVRRAQQLAP